MANALYYFLGMFGFDHPLHEIIVPMVIGPVIAAPIFALIALWFKKPTLFKTARQLNVFGFVMWFPTVLVGFLDWSHFYGKTFDLPHDAIVIKLIGAGILFLILLGNILLFKKIQPESKIHLTLYLAGAIVVSVIGYFGGDIALMGKSASSAPAVATVAPPANGGFKTITTDKFTFAWKVNGPLVDMRLSYPTTSWIAVGFNKQPVMDGADIVIGYVKAGEAMVEEDHAEGHSHSPEQKNGGKQTLTNVTGKVENGTTTLTWTMPLNTGNPHDIVLKPGERIGLILAHGEPGAQNFTSYHGPDGRTGLMITF
jgi:uncharacterized membrane protein